MSKLKQAQPFSYNKNIKRRQFLSYAAATASVAAVITSCKKTNDNNEGIDLGSGDIGVLNYAYALEQLEAAFYTQVIAEPYNGLSGDELSFLTDIRDHEIAHREFFKAVLDIFAIPPLAINFDSIDFSNRSSVLGAAKTFEDLGVSAYNGAARLLTNADYLLTAGKIVSVEARHAAYIRDLLGYGSFADTADATGLDIQNDPDTVLAAASPFILSKLNTSNLPTT